jgi:cytosine/adenosine deaminase-related metal-dependent hydrolase
MRAFSGSWLWTGDADLPPIAAGAAVFDDACRVVAVGGAAELRAKYGAAVWQESRAVLMPGLVNAHTHLELSGLRGAVAGGRGFVPWLDELLRVRAKRRPEEESEAIEQGVSELLGFGVVAVGEVCNGLKTVPALAGVPLVASVFHELLGRQRAAAEAALAAAQAERAAYGPWPAGIRYALAPHTPYTLHPTILQQVVMASAHGERASRWPTSLHLAEHAAERAFLTAGQGPFAEWIAQRGTSAVDWSPPGCDSVRYVDRLGVLGPQLTLVHLTDARPDELAIVAERGCAVVLCPRSNLHIELKLPPLLDILRAGLRPGLGTDSLASNSSLDPLAEARALRQRFPTVPPLTLLAMATSWGADALGYGDQLGSLREGYSPGLLAFEHGASAPLDALAAERFVLEHERAVRRLLVPPRYRETREVPT